MQTTTSSNTPWVLVTGGSRGIGRGLVKALATEGYTVAFTYQSSAEAARLLEQEVAAAGGHAHGIQCDGRDAAAVEQACEQLIARFGEPYGLINNMGITGDQLMFNLDVERYRDVVATPDNLIVTISQSGETADTLEALSQPTGTGPMQG